VVDHLNLSEILAEYARRDGRGMAAYHPVMMVRMLLYGYCQGVVSSRKIERATYQDVAFRYLAADQHPDHDSIAGFRQTHLQALAGLFLQALQLCEKAGLGICGPRRVRLGSGLEYILPNPAARPPGVRYAGGAAGTCNVIERELKPR
jgi:hypothetical protein